jgi:hypothetical protein
LQKHKKNWACVKLQASCPWILSSIKI